MRRTAALLGAMTLALAGAVAPAQAHEHGDEHPPGPPPLHGHVLVLGVVWDGQEPVGFRKCVDLAGGRAVPLHAHHGTVHTGQAGMALIRAGHMVVPTAPLTDIENCAHLEAMFGH